jgi:hypothetical protein
LFLDSVYENCPIASSEGSHHCGIRMDKKIAIFHVKDGYGVMTNGCLGNGGKPV